MAPWSTALRPDPAAVPVHDPLHRRQPDAGALERLGRCRRWNTPNSLFTYFMSKPTPLSRTNTTTLVRPAGSWSAISISARGRVRVNFTAFEIRLTRPASAWRGRRTRPATSPILQTMFAPVRLLRDSLRPPARAAQADRSLVRLGAADPRKREQVVDQRAHLLRRFQDHRHVPPASVVERGPALFCSSSVNPAICRSGARRSCETE